MSTKASTSSSSREGKLNSSRAQLSLDSRLAVKWLCAGHGLANLLELLDWCMKYSDALFSTVTELGTEPGAILALRESLNICTWAES